MVSILARKGRCERASIDEVYLDLTDAAEKMLAEAPPENLEVVNEETLKSHILGLDNEVEIVFPPSFFRALEKVWCLLKLLIDDNIKLSP